MHKNHKYDFAKETLVVDIIEQAQACLMFHASEPVSHQNFPLFTQYYFQSMAFEHLEKLCTSPEKNVLIKMLARSFYIFQNKQSPLPLIDIYEDEDDDVSFVTILVQDQPFLVDTVLLTLKKYGISPSPILHPVLNVQRDLMGNLISLGEHEVYTQESLISFCLNSDAMALAPSSLTEEIYHALQLAACVVNDFSDIRQETFKIADAYETMGLNSHHPNTNFKEVADFLRWIHDDRLIVLGSRYFNAKTKVTLSQEENITSPLELSFDLELEQKNTYRGLFRDSSFESLSELLPAICHNQSPLYGTLENNLYDVGTHGRIPLITISKSFKRSPVHRHSRMDSIEILDIDSNGTVFGLLQVIGIFSRDFFAQSAFRIPLLRHKINRVFERFGHSRQSYDGKYILSILKSISQDELFQFTEEQLYTICAEVFQLYNRLAVFTRHDAYGRFTSVLIYLPKERYTPHVKDLLAQTVQETLGGHVASEQVFLSEFPFARLIFVVSFHTPKALNISLETLEEKLEILSRSWTEQLEELLKAENIQKGSFISFPKSYENTFSPKEGVFDVKTSIQAICERNVAIRLFYQNDTLRIHIFSPLQAISLSKLMPLWENFGLKTICENSYTLSYLNQGQEFPLWLHAFECVGIEHFDDDIQNRLTEAFYSVWGQKTENDPFNQLILTTKLTINDVTILRAYSRSMKQMLPGFSTESLVQALSHHPSLTEKYINFFHNRFSPQVDAHEREKTDAYLRSDIKSMCKNLSNTTEERSFERLFNVMEATLRTNYYCIPKPNYLSFKFSSSHIKDLPQPAPLYEIFVYSHMVEACHLRGGKVSRGGIRWSDRMDDFRLEVFTLMKAQMLKNSIIIPVGSKGGFICKRYESMRAEGASAKALKEEVISCYTIMIRGLLDITDTYAGGNCVHPNNVICYDGEDPYLVVAADKGTASFSDTANAIAAEYNFWLGDAFASGGSYGYDHKKMAITSRGAWISTQTHFHQLHIADTEPFTVVGVGDMSGDVFGNGMLQSKNICLVAAFNHEHIFIDPTPKAEESFYERERLFKMPNSSWAHYNPDLISQGGGVFSRSIGHIPLNKHIRHLLGIPPSYDTIPPHELIQFILKAPVDLLWFGGIGTYIKATTESHHQVNDRHNDLLRVDADHVDARVIVEGANLGMTQQARIEFAKKQGRINTDAIDNSAGVSCSDHEVNIKILCQNLIEQGKITREQRNELLAQMAIEVSELVLSDNMKQNMALGLMEYASVQDLSIYQALIQNLEKAETLPLKRKGEFIPTDEELNERRVKNKGLTRPELATIMAYTKINLYQNLLDTFQKKDHYFPQKRNYLRCYFPQTLKNKYAEAIDTHPLKNEIIATVLANNVINRLGAPYVLEMCQATSSNVVDVIEAYADLDELFNLKNIWSSWKKDEKKEEAAIYYQGLYEFIQGIKQLTLVALRNKNIIKNNWVSLNALLPQIMDIFMTYQREYLALSPTKQPLFMEIGPFSPLILEFTCHIKENAQVDEINEAFKVFWDLHTTLNLQLIYDLAQKIPCTEEWQRQAKFTLLDELVQIESKLAHRMLAIGGVHTWYANNKDALQKHNTTLTWVQGALANPYEKVDIALVLHALRSLNLLYEGMKNDNK